MSQQPEVTCFTGNLSIIYLEKLIAKPKTPSPLDHGWEMKEDKAISIKLNTVKPAPEEILEPVYCTCSKRCAHESCSRIYNALLSALVHAPN